MTTEENKSVDKKRLFAFIAIAYGVSFLMMIPMYIGKTKGLDLTQIVNAQMCSPAAGVALGYLLFMKGERKVPRFFMSVLLINYIVQLLLGIASVFYMPFGAEDVITLAGDVTYPMTQIYNTMGESFLMLFSVLLWISYFVAGRERRKFVGISNRRPVRGIFLVAVFVVLYVIRMLGPEFLEAALMKTLPQTIGSYLEIAKNPLFFLSIISLPVNYLLVAIAFLGEEYGWRYYLQPIMQKKFGLKLGVILLGIVWGLWHIPVDTMFYTEDSVPQMIIGQIITCVFIGIFFGFAYLKTENIWVCVIMHFLNNNLIPILTGTFTADVLTNQHVPWFYLIEIFVLDFVVFGVFIFNKVYRRKKERKVVV